MLYQILERASRDWYNSKECTVKEQVEYIRTQGKMRDAQFEAICVYLYLKVVWQNKPLWQIAAQMEPKIRKYCADPTISSDDRKLWKAVVNATFEDENYKNLFYGVSYTDYLFSLPMGAGKTYLMAAFIYLDLYFAINEPDNPAFAHNFIVLAPSGLKSSIVPSLKNIQAFDPTWIIPEPAASMLKRMIQFEILDEQKSGKRSNLVRNPNAQKINNHQPLESCMGLVVITNAEKVILDRIDKDESSLFDEAEKKKIEIANELRHIIGNIPQFAVMIDEVHHASSGEIKLRKVVNEWSATSNFCGMLGFSGTPYLERAERIDMGCGDIIRTQNLTNVVYFYPLIKGVGNFLKIPTVKHTDNDTLAIVTAGVKEFFEKYKDTVYPDGTCAKLAIYCKQIAILEEQIYPLLTQILPLYGLSAETAEL